MIASILDFVTGGALQLVLLVLGLLPTVSLQDLPLQMPQSVTDAMGALNWFVPVGDMISIVSWWVGIILAVNAALLVVRILEMVRK